MIRTAAGLVTVLVAATTLAGCGGDSAYCAAVKDNQTTLNTFGKTRTDAAFRTYAKAVRSIASAAPDTVKTDWSKLGSVTDGVLKAHEKVGIDLKDVQDTTKLEKLSQDDLARLNKAYDAFNDTAAQRKAVVADVKDTCDITLK